MCSYLQVCRSLKGFVTDTADMAAVLAVSLSTVTAQRVGILAHLITVVTLVPILSLCLAVLSTLMAVISNLDHAQKDRLVRNISTITQKFHRIS